MPNDLSPTDGRFNYRSFIELSFNEGGVILSDGADLDGYDIVYVDFDNGTDFIQRNAYLLERVIRWVNENKTGTEPNVILSMSMGGLVSQYALRDIELAGSPANNSAFPHQVRLLITHDSPHQGANIPLSVQLSVVHLAGTTIRNPLPFSDDIRLVDRLPILGLARQALLSPAAQQMLRYQTTRATSSGGVGEVQAAQTSGYDIFQQEYQSMLGAAKVPVGTPGRPCRVVASSNGSECGRGQPFEPYAELVRVSYSDNVANFPLLDGIGFGVTAGGFVGAGLGLLFSGPVGIVGAGLIGIASLGLTGAYDLKAEYTLHALPDQQALPIYSVFAQVNKRTRLFGLFRVQFELLNFQRPSLASQLPLDSGSGGIIDLAAFAGPLGGGPISLPPGIIKVQQFCFVPTYSALNITPSSSAALRAEYSPGTNVSTPFANFRTAVRQNEGHIEYTALNSTWMLREMRQTPLVLSCASFCQGAPVIDGNPTICASESYSISGLFPNTPVTWEALPAGVLASSSATGPVFTATATGNTGRITLRATISSECGQYTVERQLYVGVPAMPTIQQLEPLDGCNNLAAGFQITNHDPTFTYTVATTGGIRQLGILSASGSFVIKAGGTGGSVEVTAGNGCGSTVSQTEIYLDPCPGFRYAIAPNPASSELTITAVDATQPEASTVPSATAPPFEVELVDGQGRKVKTGKSEQGKVRLDVRELPEGLYHLRAGQGKEAISKHIQIVH